MEQELYMSEARELCALTGTRWLRGMFLRVSSYSDIVCSFSEHTPPAHHIAGVERERQGKAWCQMQLLAEQQVDDVRYEYVGAAPVSEQFTHVSRCVCVCV